MKTQKQKVIFVKRPRLSVEIHLRDFRHEGSLDVWKGEAADFVEGHFQRAIQVSLENCLLRHGVKDQEPKHLND